MRPERLSERESFRERLSETETTREGICAGAAGRRRRRLGLVGRRANKSEADASSCRRLSSSPRRHMLPGARAFPLYTRVSLQSFSLPASRIPFHTSLSGRLPRPLAMSSFEQCPYCHNGLCRKHPAQDHGARLAAAGPANRAAALTGLFDKLIKPKLAASRLEEAALRSEEACRASAAAAHEASKRSGERVFARVEELTGLLPVNDDGRDGDRDGRRRSRSRERGVRRDRSRSRSRSRSRHRRRHRDDRDDGDHRRHHRRRRRRRSSRSRSHSALSDGGGARGGAGAASGDGGAGIDRDRAGDRHRRRRSRSGSRSGSGAR